MPALPGFRDFLPANFAKQAHIFAKFRSSALSFGFEEYAGPPLEPLDLYTKKSGPEIVSQLYNFTDKGDREIALRPELTPTLARIAAENHRNFKKPLKWFSIPQLFRYERQQKGRLREHFQFNADIIGASDPATDAELIALLHHTLTSFGLTAQHFLIRISHRGIWLDLLHHMAIPAENHPHILAVIDKIERTPAEKTQQLLTELSLSQSQISELLATLKIKKLADLPTSPVSDELKKIFDDLAALGAANAALLDLTIVRGLAYYTGTVFEAFATDAAGNPTGRAIAGGGRYDHLIKNLTGTDLPAAGFGMGDVVLSDLLDELRLWPQLQPPKKIFIAWQSDAARSQALTAAALLRQQHGIQVEYSLKPLPLNKQLQHASERAAHLLLIALDSALFEIRDFRSQKTTQNPLIVEKNNLLRQIQTLI
jgi:histidyl-tRNA synthetase